MDICYQYLFLYFNYFNIFNLTFEKKVLILPNNLIFAICQLAKLEILLFHFKRISIKNTGKIIPGHCGLMNDGMLFAFPFSFFYWSLN